MTDTSGIAQETLGVGAIIGDSFSIFFRYLGQVILLAFAPALVIALIQFMLIPTIGVDATGEIGFPWMQFAILMLLTLVGSALVTALIVRLAYDAKTGHPLRPASYVSSTLAVIAPLVVCSILATLGFMVGFALLIIPGIYLMVLWCVLTPAIVIDRTGFGSFGRSAELTKGYRWPCLGALALMILCIFAISIVIGALSWLLGGLGAPVAIFLEAVSSGLSMAFSGIFSALLYARLREIKEGTSVEQLAEVFA